MAGAFDSAVYAEDLKAGERWFSRDHGGGTQDLGHDLSVRRHTGNNSWTCNKAGTDGSSNSHSLAWRKPVYAMEDGSVERSWRNAPDNPAPGEKLAGIGADPGDIPSGGNHLLVRHADGSVMLYAHFAQGTLVSGLCPESSELIQPGQNKGFSFDPADRPSIKKGQFLGRVGNSGSSSGPHLHIHRLDQNGKPVDLPLSRGMVTPFARSGSGDCNGSAELNQWSKLNGAPIPQASVLFWPSRRLEGEYTRHRFPAKDFQRMFDHLADSGFSPEWINGYTVGGKIFYNFIWRPALRTWRAFSSLTQAQLKTRLDEADEDDFDPVHLDSFVVGGQMRYILVLHKNRPGWLLRSNRSQSQHQAILEEAKQDGLRPVSMSVVSVGGDRRYSVLYRKAPGSWSAKSTVAEKDYQEVFDENRAKGRLPVYLKAYMHGGKPFVSAIFSSSPSGDFRARHGLSSSKLQAEFKGAIQDGFGTEVITAFDGATSLHRYFAVWRR